MNQTVDMPNNEDINVAWVQCEDLKCLKWRKISRQNVELIKNTAWFCHMNPDKTKSSCEIEQEPMRKPRGHQFTFSLLEEGTLVWAKLTGYPSWPAIICSDLVENNYYSLDVDGDITHYHVEYFGEPRLHSWVLARYVEVYGTGNAPAPASFAVHRGMTSANARRSFEKAIIQADKLRALTHMDRLKNCIFKPTDSNQPESPARPNKGTTDKISSNLQGKKESSKAKHGKGGRKRKAAKPEVIEANACRTYGSQSVHANLNTFSMSSAANKVISLPSCIVGNNREMPLIASSDKNKEKIKDENICEIRRRDKKVAAEILANTNLLFPKIYFGSNGDHNLKSGCVVLKVEGNRISAVIPAEGVSGKQRASCGGGIGASNTKNLVDKSVLGTDSSRPVKFKKLESQNILELALKEQSAIKDLTSQRRNEEKEASKNEPDFYGVGTDDAVTDDKGVQSKENGNVYRNIDCSLESFDKLQSKILKMESFCEDSQALPHKRHDVFSSVSIECGKASPASLDGKSAEEILKELDELEGSLAKFSDILEE